MLLTLSACKKNDEVKVAVSKWTIGNSSMSDKTYTSTSAKWITPSQSSYKLYEFKAKEKESQAYISFVFKTKPTTSGLHPIFIGNWSNDLTSSQVGVELFNGTDIWYHAHPGGIVDVTIEKGKTTITFSKIRAYKDAVNFVNVEGKLVEN